MQFQSFIPGQHAFLAPSIATQLAAWADFPEPGLDPDACAKLHPVARA